MEPDVLLLDEPTSALDEEATERIVGVLHRFDRTMLVVSRDAGFLRRVTSRCILRDCTLRDG